MFLTGKRKYLLILVSCLIVVTVLDFAVLGAVASMKRENKEQEAYIYGQSIANSIQLTLDNTLLASETLKYFYLQYGEDFYQDFEQIAAQIVEDHPVIASVYLAPKGVIQLAYPKKVHDSTIGFEMLKDPAQGPRAQLAIDTKKITVAGPHQLIEGGIGFIVRNPVFQEDEFLGFTIIVLDWNRFVEQMLGNTKAPSDKYLFAVWKNDPDDTAVVDSDGFIFRNGEKTVLKKVTVSFEVPNDVWNLSVEPVDGWLVYSDMMPGIFATVIISVILILLVLFLFLLEDRKRQLAREQADNQAKSRYMEQLSEALEKAKKADVAKSNFFSQMSHDIRTPLNGILGLMEINEKHADDRALVDANRAKAKVAAKHLQSLISDVLEISKLDDDKVELAYEPFSMLELAQDVLTMAEMRAMEAGIRVNHSDCHQEITVPVVMGSPLHLRQVMMNIFGNAIKYNKKNGSISCNIRQVAKSETQVTYQVTISDTGIGMSKEFMQHMYEPFAQERNDARSTYMGTGLGMTIVKNLVDRMHGTIEVDSQMGVGTTFVITIPFDIAPVQELPKKVDVKELDLTGVSILLVEDNELNQEIAAQLLSDMGAKITAVTNGQEAVEAFSSMPADTYQLILMDLMMPVMDGYEATRRIRDFAREDAKTIPIVAMTANAFAEDVQRCLQCGMNAHIAKPLDLTQMKEVLARVCHGDVFG